MPFYEYECEQCGQWAVLSRLVVERDEPAECAVCGESLSRRFSLPHCVTVELGTDAVENAIEESAKNRELVKAGTHSPIAQSELINMKPFGRAKLRQEGQVIGSLAKAQIE